MGCTQKNTKTSVSASVGPDNIIDDCGTYVANVDFDDEDLDLHVGDSERQARSDENLLYFWGILCLPKEIAKAVSAADILIHITRM